VLVLAAAPHGFTIAEFAAKVHAMAGQTVEDYTIRQAVYELQILRGIELIDKPGRTRRYHAPPHAVRTIAALLTLRDHIIGPILAGVRSAGQGRAPANWRDTTVPTNASSPRCKPCSTRDHFGLATPPTLAAWTTSCRSGLGKPLRW
jgi:hypothetical protein